MTAFRRDGADANARNRDGNAFKSEPRTLSIRAKILITPNGRKNADTQPDYRVTSSGVVSSGRS
jgi:uncharacterized protein (DUF736 family)